MQIILQLDKTGLFSLNHAITRVRLQVGLSGDVEPLVD